MKLSKWFLIIGCLTPIAFIFVFFAYLYVGEQITERNNEIAKAKYEELCSPYALLDDVNRKKWLKLKADVISRKIDSRDLYLYTEKYNGYYKDYSEYRNKNGYLDKINGDEQLFRQKMYIKYNNKDILYFNNIILIQKSFINIGLSMGYGSVSCYGDIGEYSNIFSYHID